MPVAEIKQAIERRNLIAAYVRTMKEGEDYGVVPGTKGKPTLFKQGAENLSTFFGLVPDPITIHSILDFDGSEQGNGEPLIYYEVRCDLYRNGVKVGSGTGVCSSREKKYRYRTVWVNKQPKQILNPDIADIANTIKKMADKRALVAAVLIATAASSHFTQDMEDQTDDANTITVEAKPAPEPEPTITETQLKHLHAVGTEVYGKDWDDKRHELVGRITKGRTESSSDLTEAQAQKLIDGISEKRKTVVQAATGKKTVENGKDAAKVQAAILDPHSVETTGEVII